jgi:phage gpG-like protein
MLQVTLDSKSLQNAVHALTRYTNREIAPHVRKVLAETTLHHIKTNASARLNKASTGALERSFRTVERGDVIEIVSDSAYARIHDKGGVITAKRSKNLAIPLEKGLRGISPRQLGRPMFAITSRSGNKLLVERSAGGVNPLYLLKPQVRIQPTNYISDALRTGKAEAMGTIARWLTSTNYKV